MQDNPIEILTECLFDLNAENNGIPVFKNTADKQKYIWAKRQLEGLIFELKGMLADLEEGLSIYDLGYLTLADFIDQVNDIRRQMTNFRMMLKSLLELC